MDFQIHRHPSSATTFDLVVIANFSTNEAAALSEVNAWDHACIARLDAGTGLFFKKYTKYSPRFRELVDPGLLIKDLTSADVADFQVKWESRYAVEVQQSLIPALTAYRRRVHCDQEAQRDAFFKSGQLQLAHQPTTQLIHHDHPAR